MACTLCQRQIRELTSLADEASWYCVFVLVTLLLVNSFKKSCTMTKDEEEEEDPVKGISRMLDLDRACHEIYVVGEGETLDSITHKCADPFIVEQNPHIHDPDDVFPEFVIKITLVKSRNH